MRKGVLIGSCALIAVIGAPTWGLRKTPETEELELPKPEITKDYLLQLISEANKEANQKEQKKLCKRLHFKRRNPCIVDKRSKEID